MKSAQIEKDREIRRLEKRFNEEIEEMENLLFEVQQKLADGTKGPLPEGKYWIFMQREEYDDLVQRDEKLSKRITDIEKQLQSTEQQIEEQSAAIVQSQPIAMVQSMVNDNHELGYGYIGTFLPIGIWYEMIEILIKLGDLIKLVKRCYTGNW